MSDKSSSWGDLTPRILSAVVLIALAGAALTSVVSWSALVIIVLSIGFWELAALAAPGIGDGRRLAVGALPMAGLLVALVFLGLLYWPPVTALAVGTLAALVAAVALVPGGRVLFAAYAVMLVWGAVTLVVMRAGVGPVAVLFTVGIVVVSDVLGYFAGRILGGPKFWPRVSPKKTWSGTAAGWIGAALFGALSAPVVGMLPLVGAGFAVLLAFAGQMGDIAESAIKRRAGAKDSSALIPGHGGVLDRIDALIAAASLAGLIAVGYAL